MKTIFQKDYHGFEDIYDLGRDISECLDPQFNPLAAEIPGEFQGMISVKIEYSGEPKPQALTPTP